MGTFWCAMYINPLETRSPFCWRICCGDFSPQHYPYPGESKPVMPDDFEMIKLVRANHVAQAMFFRIILKLFRKIACGLSSPNHYSQDVDANGRPRYGIFGLVDIVALKSKESSRMSQYAYGQICPRFSNFTILLNRWTKVLNSL